MALLPCHPTAIMVANLELKTKLAIAVRLMAMEGMIDFNGHVSLRLPEGDKILINSRFSNRVSLTAADIVTVDLQGRLLEGNAEPPSEVRIHTAIYKRRPDVGSVAHLHPRYATIFTIASVPLKPVYIIASGLNPEGVPVLDDSCLIHRDEQAEAVAEALGQGSALLLRAHGAVTVGSDVEGAFAVAVALEENARTYLWASALGMPRILGQEEMAAYGTPVSARSTKYKIWNFYTEKARVSGWLAGL